MEYFESSSSSSKPVHVYLSFRGDDDTCKFIHRLSAALKAQGLRIMGDDKKLEKKHSNLPPHLLQAIQKSWIWIVVFSKNYASSSWCLKELEVASCNIFDPPGSVTPMHYVDPVIAEHEERFEADIDKVKLTMKQMTHRCGPTNVRDRVIPVYYDVDPSFAEHVEEKMGLHIEERMAERTENIQERDGRNVPMNLDNLLDGLILDWSREFIKEVVNLSGWDVHNSGSQAIQGIVREVKKKKDQIFYGHFSFVGMQSRMEEAEKLMHLGSGDEVRVVGICGMGGLGKSSLAAVLYLKIFHHFDAFCFLSNVSGYLKHGDLSLKELLHRNLETDNSEIRDIISEEFLACKRLRKHKILIVLDGVDLVQNVEELDLVEKSESCFGQGSRVIITTRDEKVLEMSKVDAIYKPILLTKDEAFQLFCSKAFQSEYPIGGFEEMIYKVLEYADGLPFAIEMLGSFLFGKSIPEWRNFLSREEIIPPYYIMVVLRKSFDELDEMSKDMFLDIACFFAGKDISYAKEILHDCGFFEEIGIKLLIEKSLITISKQRIQMHRMLQAMGREIVRQECPSQPKNRSRLWLFSDTKHVMSKNCVFSRDREGKFSMSPKMAIENVEAIVLDLEETKRVTLRIEALSYMSNLRLLIFRNVNFSGTLYNLSGKLRYVSWHQYPFTSLPSSFKSDTLVQLIMPESNITEVWMGKMMLPNLRSMNLHGSKNLIKTPDFEGVPNLEKLDLEGCTGLLQLDPSIAKLPKLKVVNLRNCINLVSIPNSLFSLSYLEILNLACCTKLASCLNYFPFEELNDGDTPQQSFPSKRRKLWRQKSI